jgi:hypothetical protein
MDAGILINLYEDEKVVLVIRRHWFAFLQSIFITFILLLVFFIAFFILNSRLNASAAALCITSPAVADNIGKGALIIFSSIYLLSVCAFFYVSWLDYYLDIFMITNKRILRIEQLVLFGQNISETSLQHIQDVSSRVRGIIYTILGVGTIFIETAGERANFTFTFIKKPGEVAAQILELQKEMWGDEGFKEDMTLERKKEKIEKMNTGDPLRKKEEAEKAILIKEEIFEEPKKEPHILIRKIMSAKDKLGKIRVTMDDQDKKGGVNIKDFEKKTVKNLDQKHYSDGRMIISEGVIWQSEQEINQDILDTLNNMEEEG